MAAFEAIEAMADARCPENGGARSREAAGWNEFASDLRSSLLAPRVLTLSRLSNWVRRLGELASFVLSGCLSRPCLPALLVRDDRSNSVAVGAGRSARVARERTAYLRSACPLARPPRNECGDPARSTEDEDVSWNDRGGRCAGDAEEDPTDDSAARTRRRRRRLAEREIANLQATLAAARVSLWAFERCSLSDGADGDAADAPGGDTAEGWWREFRDLMGRSGASAAEFEGRHLAPADRGAGGRGASADDGADDAPKEDARIAKSSEHVSDAAGTEEGDLRPNGDGPASERVAAESTLVFSGSGTRKPSHRRDVPTSSEQGNSSPPSSNAADQVMLLRDLEKRTRTMALAEEHQVVDVDEVAIADVGSGGASERGRGDGVTSSSSNGNNDKRREGRSQPCFLGASGSLLAELNSAMAGRPLHDGASEEEGVE